VPTFAANHERALAVVDFRSCFFGALRKILLNASALIVYLIELGGKALRLFEIVGHQQIERQIGITHAACGIQARNERERQPRRGYLLVAGVAHVNKRLDAWTGIFVHALQAIGNERTVLVAHGHKVGDGSQRRKIGVFAPQMGLSKAGAQSLDNLQCNAHTGQNAAFAFRVALRVTYNNAFRNQIARLVVVGHYQVDAFGQNRWSDIPASDAAINCHDQIGVERLRALESRRRYAVAFFKTLRNEGRGIGSEKL